MSKFFSFNAAEPDLVDRRKAARDLCASISHGLADRASLYRDLFGSVGEGFEQWGGIFCEFGWNIKIGDNVFINANGVFLDAFDINIGNHVFIGPNVGIYTSNHAKDLEQRRNYMEWGAPVTLEDDVWIGGGAIILPGVTIGKGSIVGAGAVVAKSVPACSKVLGARSQVYPLVMEI
ncbi:sugar O-acetyltransferase [Chromobacterium vaccinii]|uniref:sugar O-acetyltransferase n=1 Tax=Chromobacterium vaccinii TaxID=1108595 RepID=UPI003C773614